MKKQIGLKLLKSALMIALLTVTTFSFAQRGERRGGGGGGSRGASGGGPSAVQRGGGGGGGSRQSYSQGYSQRQSAPAQRSYSNQSYNRSNQNNAYNSNRTMAYNRVSPNGYSVNRAGAYSGYNRGGYSVNRAGSYRASGAYYRPHYSRPPVIYNGYRYYSHYNYSYHPYIPFYYGAYFHPFGYFSLGLSPYAYELAWENQNYWYDQGTYYQPYNNGYKAVPAPVGSAINDLPKGYTTINVNGGTYYYYAGTFYLNGDNGFEVVPAPPGAVVYDLPAGATEKVINGTTYVNYNDTWYLPVTLDGKDGYEVVDVEKDDNF